MMALVILGFGALALTRSVDTGTLIMGNLGFRQDAVVASSSGAEQAMTWLAANQGAKLDANDTTRGYYASVIDELDPSGTRTSTAKPLPIVNWDDNCLGLPEAAYKSCKNIVPYSGAAVNGNKVMWVIQRMCDAPVAPSPANRCVRPATLSTSTTRDRSELQPGGRLTSGLASPFYRIIVRVEGPRNTVSYTESIVHF
jgi:hypothetical protein